MSLLKVTACGLAVVLLACFSTAAPSADLVTNLPGIAVQPSFKHYSGYLQAGADRRLHYWFVSSQSLTRATDPVVLWLNGGPGCSSLDGLLSEHGPFLVADNGSLVINPFAWNLRANVLYLEAPAGVGFSYSVSGKTETDDDQTASDNALAIEHFFSKFPELANNDFFITGESYGGVYVPTLAQKLVHNPHIRLRGFAVGNGLSSYSLNSNSMLYFFYYHGIIGDALWNQMLVACCGTTKIQRCSFTNAVSQSASCQKYVQTAMNLADNIDIYNLYGPCFTPKDTLQKTNNLRFISNQYRKLVQLKHKPSPPQIHRRHLDLQNLHRPFAGRANLTNLRETPPCVNATALTSYLNNFEVRRALHIPDILPGWMICSDKLQYNRVYQDMSAVYKDLLRSKLRILIYNGDIDMACNFLGDEWFTNSLFGTPKSARRQWLYTAADGSQQVAGWVKQFQNDRAFLTIRGAGHMVPTDKPRPALKMFHNFLDGQEY